MIIKCQLRWVGHVVRMDHSRLPKQIMYSELEVGRHAHGKQHKRFKDTENLKQCNIKPDNWESIARNRTNSLSTIDIGTQRFEEQK